MASRRYHVPEELRTRIFEVARRIWWLRIVQGMAWAIILLSVVFGALVIVDHFFKLPALVRKIDLSVWVGLACSTILGGLLIPLLRKVRAADLAAVIEQKYPQLGERLSTSIELAEEAHGSPALIDLLIQETNTRSSGLEFRRAIPANRAGWLVGAAAVALTLLAVPGFLWPSEYANLSHRFFFPWRITLPDAPYNLAVNPGDVYAGRGRTIELTATVSPNKENAALPSVAEVIFIDGSGKEVRERMKVERPEQFSFKHKVNDDVRYRIQAGDVVSKTFTITAVTPVELAAESPTFTIVSPEYAKATVPDQTVRGLVHLTALKYSQVGVQVRFTRPALSARLLWETTELKQGKDGTTTEVTTIEHSLPLAEDRLGASIDLPAVNTGKYRLVLEAEHGVRTEYEGSSLTVNRDQPPAFPALTLKLPSEERLKTILPYDRLPVEFTLEDDIGAASAELEYRINDEPVQRESIPLDGINTRSAKAAYHFALAGKVKEGDVLSYRLRGEDNLPRDMGGPNFAHYPPDRWLRLKVAKQGDPLKLQEILAQRDDIRDRIEAIKNKLSNERAGVKQVQQAANRKPELTPEQTAALKELRQDNRVSTQNLRQLAMDYENTPALAPLLNQLDDVADDQLQKADTGLRKAQQSQTPVKERDQALQSTDQELGEAIKRLDELQKLNDKVAQDRQDQARVELLAQREQELARQAAELAKRDPVRDPQAQEELNRIRQEQEQIARELAELTKNSPALQEALRQARAQQTEQLAQEARDLAQAQRDLAQASKETEQNQLQGKFADLARAQEELARQAEDLARQTERVTPAAKTNPLDPEQAKQAAEALKQGDPDQALQKQQQTAQQLERLGQDLARAVNLARDPREAARQLARMQDDLRKRTMEESQRKDADKPLSERLQAFAPEQEAIQRGIEQLSIPPGNEGLEKDQDRAAELAKRAEEALAQADPRIAADNMELTKKTLEELARNIPDIKKRQRQALQALQEIQKQQQQASEQAARALQDPDAKKQAEALQEAARKLADAAGKLEKVDPANQEARLERAQEAMNEALADLTGQQKPDIPLSQEEAKRQLDRLAQALKGQEPVDEQARQLAQEQRQLAEESAQAAKTPTTPQQQQALQQRQQQLAQRAAKLDAPEAPVRKAEAARATEAARQAAQQNPTAPQTQEQMKQAAEKLEDLARQLAGQETPAEQADRLAKKQAQSAAQAQQQPEAQNAQRAEQLQQVQRETEQLRTGQQAQAEKEQALQKLTRAQQAPAQEQAQAQREAADALRDLADKMAGRDTPAEKAAELAREQQQLAQQANQKPANQSAEEAKQAAEQAAQAQADLARRLERMNARQQAAQQAQQQTAQAMKQAQQALQQGKSPQEAQQQLAQAAQAAKNLADQLAREQPQAQGNPQANQQSPQEMARQLAQQQRQLAQATQQAQKANQPQRDQAMQQLARQQDQLRQQTSQVPAPQGQNEAMQQAQQAMRQAQQALARNDAGEAAQKQNDAARALEQAANQLPNQANQPQQAQANQGNQPLPTQEQAQQAQALARQQRALQEAVRQVTQQARAENAPAQQNPVGELARMQQQVAQQAAELARAVGQEQGQTPAAQQAQQAQQATQQAAQQMQAGALPSAQQTGEQAAEQLRRLAQQLAQTPAPANPTGTDPLQQARDLARQQEELNRQLAPLAGNPDAQRAQQQAQQQQLGQQAGELMQDLQNLANQLQGNQGQQSAQQASQSAQQANQAMQQAQQQGRQGNTPQTQQAQQQAAQALDRAAQQASQSASQQMASQQGQPQEGNPSQQAGQAVQQAQNNLSQAQNQLAQGQPQQAQASMQQAAQSLGQTAQAMAQQMQQQPGQPNQEGQNRVPMTGAAGGGSPDDNPFGLDLPEFAGKTWGELPGELRTKIVQDAQAKYGEDYARMIRLYFEQLADTQKRRQR